ncbi:MAG: tetratricopeptide repeat protein, partial [Erysipelotrichia bacterium]|nr:tetratricopeptide repeat protein [Erysipelotrichia bacterium]
AYNKAKDYDKAIESLEMAIKKMPNHGGAYTNLGNVYNKLYDYKTAAKMHEKSIELEPNGSNAYGNVGTSYKYLGFSNKAILSYKKAIELDPNFVNAHFDLATMYLSNEDFKNGWKEYEWRFRKEEMIPHIIKHKDIFSKPLFTGKEDIKDKTLLLHSEQGFGDSIQFIRFLPTLKEKYGCKIAVKCREGLKELFKSIEEIDVIVDRSEETPAFDYQLSIMSMAYILDMKSINDLPNKMPYLSAKKDDTFNIKKVKGKINIGICWSASLTGESYEGKVFDLKFFEPLMNNPKINLYSLQVGDGSEDIKKYGYEKNIIDLTAKLTDFSKTASLINELDLVISSDTAVAHLTGALNKPVW